MPRVPVFQFDTSSNRSTTQTPDEPAEVVRKPLKVKAVWIPMDQWRWLRDTAAVERRTMQGLLAEILTRQAETAASLQESVNPPTDYPANPPTDRPENRRADRSAD